MIYPNLFESIFNLFFIPLNLTKTRYEEYLRLPNFFTIIFNIFLISFVIIIQIDIMPFLSILHIIPFMLKEPTSEYGSFFLLKN